MSGHSTGISSPGKVLVAGGYLVVDRAYTGLAFGLSARMHAHIHAGTPIAQSDPVPIIVRSPQFKSAEWKYSCSASDTDGSGLLVSQDQSSPAPRNKFVETVLQYALTYVTHTVSFSQISPVIITILADTAYYSHADTATRNPKALPDSPFLDFNVSLSDAHKTGLGSSAALVTALTSALLVHFLPSGSATSIDVDSTSGKRRIHNLAQLAHCSAQGKVGSGFDVAAAVYGSCTYRRFSPSVLDGLGAANSPGFAGRLAALVDDEQTPRTWDTEIAPSGGTMAPGLCLLMADVDCGSETPGMVKQVFAWRAADRAGADGIWAELQAKNELLGRALLGQEQGVAAEDDNNNHIATTLAECRGLIRQMSRASGVPVEPPAQTALLDACAQVDGVLGGLVPGAGGYDALVLVARDTPDTKKRLQEFLADYKAPVSQGNEPQIGKVGLLDVKQEMEGVRKEDVGLYKGFF